MSYSFDVDKWQFKQPIYSKDLEYMMMGIEGVRAVNFVRLTQGLYDFSDLWDKPLYYYDKDYPLGDDTNGDSRYGWQYNFDQFYTVGNGFEPGIILPSLTPSVFELKHPRENIKGVVR